MNSFLVYECKFKVFSGNLYIFPSYVCFYAKAFGFAKKVFRLLFIDLLCSFLFITDCYILYIYC